MMFCLRVRNILTCCPCCPARTWWRVVGEMETDTGQATEMPALDCSEGGDDEDARAEVLETVTGALDLPGAATNTAADTGAEESSIQEPSSSTGGQRKESYC